jgi:thymidylate synthase (FAD)
MSTSIKVLDHGSIRLIESWGSDERIIEAARMSTDKGFIGWGPKCRRCGDLFDGSVRDCPSPTGEPYVDSGRGGHIFDAPGDEKLLKYLWDNKHSTPFEMAGATIEVEAPIFVFREWHRHRTQSYSELSSRYTPLPDTNYIPTVERLMLNSKTNKQAGTIKGALELTPSNAQWFQDEIRYQYERAETLYKSALDKGVPKELARIHLPVGRYSRMRASAVLRNWLGFLTLRMAPGAQWEIREYANALHNILVDLFPRTLSLFDVGL